MQGLFVVCGPNLDFSDLDLMEAWPGLHESALHSFSFANGYVGLVDTQFSGSGKARTETCQAAVDGLFALDGQADNIDLQARATELARRASLDGPVSALNNIVAGAFVAAINDRNTGRIFVASDLVGSIPCYYVEPIGGGFITSTNPVALARTRLVPLERNDVYLAAFMRLGFPLEHSHAIKAISTIPPNNVLHWSPAENRVQLELLTRQPYHCRSDWQNLDLEHAFSCAQGAVRRLSGAAGKQALFLSGGLDSRLILAAKPDDLDFGCFTYGNTNSIEVEIARQVAGASTQPFEHVAPSGDDVAAAIDPIFDMAGFIVFPERYFAAKILAARGYQSANDGFLADVFFACGMHNLVPYPVILRLMRKLGIFVDSKLSACGTDELASQLFQIASAVVSIEKTAPYLANSLFQIIDAQHDEILQLIAREIDILREHTDSLVELVTRFFAKNRSTASTAQQGVVSRCHTQILYPFACDKQFVDLASNTHPRHLAFRSATQRLLKLEHRELAAIPYARTLTPATWPTFFHKPVGSLSRKQIYLPFVNSRYKGLNPSPAGWPSWLRESARLRAAARDSLLGSDFIDKSRLDIYLSELATGQRVDTGRLFHFVALDRWDRF